MVGSYPISCRRFEGKVAVVTAAASGIGQASARRLAEEGGTVIALDIDPNVKAVGDELGERYGKGEAYVMNATDRADVEARFRKIYGDHGNIDVLANVVGRTAGSKRGEFYLSEPETWDEVVDVSLKSTMLCCRQVVPAMRERRAGKIVNISSAAWMVPTPTFTDYAAAKAGVMGFSRVLAVELAPFNVNVNLICPGPITTAATDRHPDDLRAALIATIPLRRYGDPEDIAAGVAYLSSEDARFVTGHNLVISGGRAIG